MLKLLYKIHVSLNRDKLGAANAYPLPWWFSLAAKKFKWTPTQQMLRYARMLEGTDLSFLAPNEYGCAESVTRIWNALFKLPIFTATTQMYEYMRTSGKFIEIASPVDGCITVAVTEFRNGETINGHTGVGDRGMLLNNNSATGKWLRNWLYEKFYKYYHDTKKLDVHHFILKNSL